MAAESIGEYLRGLAGSGDRPFAGYQARCEQGMDVVEELIEVFWNQPLGFAFLVHSRHVDDFIDLFAGRVYQEKPSAGLEAIRALRNVGLSNG